MKRGWILPLSGHISVTDHTPVCHRGAAPEGNMTQVTLSGDLSMGTYTVQRCTSPCIIGAYASQRRADLSVKLPWAEQRTTRCKREPCHDKEG
ncbi:MAG TPA: hypothetical protein VF359_08665 [Anaerolineales bacterium]